MSNFIDEYRKRNLKVREIRNQYKMGLHPLLVNPNAPTAPGNNKFTQQKPGLYSPAKDFGGDSDKMDISSEESKTAKASSPTHSEEKSTSKQSDSQPNEEVRTESSNRRFYFDDFEYNDPLNDCFCKPLLDDEDWISSDEESDEENMKNSSAKGNICIGIDDEELRNAANFMAEESKGLNNDDSSDEEEEKGAINPEKVNWMKYIFNKYIMPDDQFYQTINRPEVIGSILNIILSDNSDEAIQGDLIDLVGAERFEMIVELISKRKYIQDYCNTISQEISKDKKKQNTGHNPYQFSTGVTVTYKDQNKKKGKKKEKAKQKSNAPRASNHELLEKLGFESDFIEENRKLGLKTRGEIDWFTHEYGDSRATPVRKAQEFRAEGYGRKPGYKQDTFDEPDWKEVHLTPPKKHESQQHELKSVSSLPEWMRPAFKGTENLNTIQSIVFESAFNSVNNILVAAPTGAGKTNIALLTILKEVKAYAHEAKGSGDKCTINMTGKPMKIVYLAPLKALASEIVEKFTKALSYLNIKVREMTGDMNLTKAEIKETHIIVSTPEKWDVVTRKSDSLMNEINLMIIDEIHLLNDERGTVLECLVARALTTLIRSQKMIRILGLSATLPNYIDVADFIHAPDESTFYFDPSYRPTPLRCRFYGIKDYGSIKRAENVMNEITYMNIIRCLKMGKQVLVFVHKRNSTVTTAKDLIEILRLNPKDRDLFECENSHKMNRQVEQSKDKNVKELFMKGFGIHHAGMQRAERHLSEKLFEGGHIKVLCTTATLAWGINLPAYCTIIKGTQIYDSNVGEFRDIGIFDVQQIFGRAGRPQYDSEGEGIICTTGNKIDNYVKMMSNEQDIESHLHTNLDDCLNAEISIGTVTTTTEAIQWIKFTYLWIRLKRNPRHYGVDMKSLQEDPGLNAYLFKLVSDTFHRLNSYKLVKYFTKADQVSTTDMGRISSNYYVNVKTMDYFIKNITVSTPEEKLLFHMAHSSEFEQIRGRPEEEEELTKLYKECAFIDIEKDEILENYGKTLILLESYLRGQKIEIADLGYIVQNAARVIRALFEFCLKKNFSRLTRECLKWCKLIDRRLPPDAHPLRQFTYGCNVGKLTNAASDSSSTQGLMPACIANDLERACISLDQIYKGEDSDIISYTVGAAYSGEMYKFVKFIPQLEVKITTKTITRSILEIHIVLFPNFVWNKKWNGKSEPFWILVSNGEEIFTSTLVDIVAATKQYDGSKGVSTTLFVPYEIGSDDDKVCSSTYYEIDILSDKWVGVDFYESLYLEDIEIPEKDYPHTKLLPLKPLPITALKNKMYERLYSSKFEFFNPIQTQVFHNLYHNDMNVLIGAPTSSGKTIMSELAILRVFNEKPDGKIIYIAPMKALAKERIIDWKRRFQEGELKKTVVELTGDFTPDLEALKKASLVITTPEKWDGISRNWQHREYVRQVALVIIDEIHLLGQERGPVIEVIVSRFRYITAQTKLNVRIVGLSTALANAKDVADWLGINRFGLYNFKPSVRPVPIEVYIEGFPEKHYCPRMATMNKPTYKAIMTHARNHPTLVFVSSRRQTRLTALDLIALMSGQELTGDYDYQQKGLNNAELEAIQYEIDDDNLRNTIQFGIGMHHAGLTENDRKIVENLFVNKKISILVTTSTLAWGVNFPARLVVIKGTEYFDAKTKRYVDIPVSDILQMMGRAGRPQFDNKGIACIFVAEEKKNFYKKFLYEPFPVESSLPGQLVEHLNAEIAAGTLNNIDNCIDYMTWTYFFRRLTKNPSFYKLDHGAGAAYLNDYLKELIIECLNKLEKAKCVEVNKDDGSIISTPFGYLCSFYYVFHETIFKLFSEIKPGMNHQAQFLSLLTSCKEFQGLPVRHNEDVLNEALSFMCPIKIPKNDLDSPHIKANLLLQAHLSRVPLPITDYITDTKSVLDQTVRVVQCMIDVAAHLGYLDTTLSLINFQQMMIQGCWQNDSTFRNIPFFNDKMIRKLSDMGIYHLCQLIPKLPDLTNFIRKELKEKMDVDQLKIIYSALSHIPIVNIAFNLQAVNSNGDATTGPLSEGGEAILTVKLEKKSKDSNSVIIKSFPKAKDAGWFLIVGNPVTNEMLVLKRTPLKKYAKRELNVPLPINFKNEKLKLYLLSDAYIGIDQVVTIDCRKVNVIIEKVQSGELSNTKIEDQFELIQNIQSESDNESSEPSDRERNELSDSDYSEDSESYASDVSDDLIEKNIDCWI